VVVGDRGDAYRILMGRLDGRRPLQASYNAGRVYNIKMDLQECGNETSGFIQCREGV